MDSSGRVGSTEETVNTKTGTVKAEDHGQKILSVLQNFREQNIFFDVNINVKDESIPCHRCVLAGSSDFFRTMFEVNMKERNDGNVTINNLSPEHVKAFLDYAYTGKAEVTKGNVDMLFQVSSFLQVPVLEKACSVFLLKTIDISNYQQLLSLADSYGSTHLFDGALDFILHNFQSITQSPDFLDMNARVLEKCLENDDLYVPDEDSVLMAALAWTRENSSEKRERFFPQLISKVRLHQVSQSVLQHVLESEEQLLTSTDCLSKVSEAIQSIKHFVRLFNDARNSTTEKYIFVHKTADDGGSKCSLCYNIKTDLWLELPPTNIPDLPGSSLSSFGEVIFITGGCTGSCCRPVRLHIAESHHEATDQTWCYCPSSNSCFLVSAMKKPRTMHTSVTTINNLYVIGGKTKAAQDIGSLRDVEAYNPLTKEWKSVAPLPKGIYYPEARACKSIIYVLGSEFEIAYSPNPSINCFFKYNVNTDQWCELVADFGHVFYATLIKAVTVNSSLYIYDFGTGKGYTFCPETCTWKDQDCFECDFNAGTVGIEDKIYILGGDYSPDDLTDDVLVYHYNQSKWEEVSSMPKALTEFSCDLIQFNKCRDPWAKSHMEAR